MTGDRRKRIAPHDSTDVPRFAPNFTVYLLPHDVLCLYSEDRKFFLHGALYCALAGAIAEGGKSFRELARALERNFPPDTIREALKRLVERRFVVAKPHASSHPAAYWSSLGPPPRRFAARARHARTKRHRARRSRDSQSDRHRLRHGSVRSHRQPRPVGVEHRAPLRAAASAMSGLRPKETARSAPRARADRAGRGQQARHDQRRLSHRFFARHRRALS